MAGPIGGGGIPSPELTRLVAATERAAAATIVAALITASGRPHSVDEAIELMRDVSFSLNPSPQSGNYQAWAKTKNTAKVHD